MSKRGTGENDERGRSRNKFRCGAEKLELLARVTSDQMAGNNATTTNLVCCLLDDPLLQPRDST